MRKIGRPNQKSTGGVTNRHHATTCEAAAVPSPYCEETPPSPRLSGVYFVWVVVFLLCCRVPCVISGVRVESEVVVRGPRMFFFPSYPSTPAISTTPTVEQQIGSGTAPGVRGQEKLVVCLPQGLPRSTPEARTPPCYGSRAEVDPPPPGRYAKMYF
jgi:hypothetical protein